VQNPGFETACGSVPCNWNTFASTIARDTVNPHSGSASLAATASGAFAVFGASSDCFLISPSTAYTVDGWYRTTSASVTSLQVVLLEYSGAACDVALVATGGPLTASPVTTGAWTFLSGQVTTDATIQSGRLLFEPGCSGQMCPDTTTANFDDGEVSVAPLAVSVFSFSARRTGKGVLVRWRTGTETNELGFNVYRLRNGHRVRANRRLIPAVSVTRGGISGGTYSYLDRRAPRHAALRYWLQEVATNGARTWHGPVRVNRS
jgi:hypothetical protein